MDHLYPFLWVALLLLLVIGGLLLLFLSRLRKKTIPYLPYIATPLLTDAERRFFAVLEGAIPRHCYLLAQVRLANLVTVKPGSKSFWKDFSAIGLKCVDFVVVRRDTMAVLLVVELDDRSHERVERKERDKFIDEVLTAVGLPILHWPVEGQYNPRDVSRAITARMNER